MRIGLGLESATGYAEGVLLGVAAYARPARAWTFDHGDSSLQGIERLLAQKPDGVVFCSSDNQVINLIAAAKVAAVNAHFWEPPAPMGSVASDDHVVGELAAEHFLARGHRRFAYFPRTGWAVDARLHGFTAALARSGATPATFEGVPPSVGRKEAAYEKALLHWLQELPKPVAIFCANDRFAWHVSERCRRLKLRVPTHVAILGVDNDRVICSLADPPLSSVQTGSERIGYEAARLLEQLMAGGVPESRHVLVQPVRVVGRRSTDAVVAEDKLVAGALRHMKSHLVDNIGLELLAKRLHCSRRTLERRFREVLGVSPAHAWTRFRLEEAQHLLADSELKLPLVAELSGFREAKYLSEAFKKLTGQTPGKFRHLATPSTQAVPPEAEESAGVTLAYHKG